MTAAETRADVIDTIVRAMKHHARQAAAWHTFGVMADDMTRAECHERALDQLTGALTCFVGYDEARYTRDWSLRQADAQVSGR